MVHQRTELQVRLQPDETVGLDWSLRKARFADMCSVRLLHYQRQSAKDSPAPQYSSLPYLRVPSILQKYPVPELELELELAVGLVE